MLMAKKNQLKKAYFFWTSFSSASSNWSAPNEETQGLMPPVPRAIRASEPYRKLDWPSVAGMHGLAVHSGGRKLSTDAEMVRSTIPYCNRN